MQCLLIEYLEIQVKTLNRVIQLDCSPGRPYGHFEGTGCKAGFEMILVFSMDSR